MAEIFYVLECTARECDAEFLLNDIPVTRRGPAHGAFAGVQVNEFVVDGVNETSIVIGPGPTPGDAIQPKAGARRRATVKNAQVKVRLVRYPRGAAVGGPKGKELMALSWSVEGEARVVLPRVESDRRDLGALLGRWSWQDAPRVELDEQAVAEITALVRKIREDLDKGSPEELIARSRVRLDEITSAYDLEEGEKEHLIRTVTREDAARDGWGMQPLDEDAFSLRTCARSRVVEVVGRDWKPVLKEKPAPDGSLGLYDMFVARVGGAWQIVR